MGSNNCFSAINAYIFLSLAFVNKHLNASHQQTANTSAFIEAFTLDDEQLIKHIWSAAPGCYLPCYFFKEAVSAVSILWDSVIQCMRKWVLHHNQIMPLGFNNGRWQREAIGAETISFIAQSN